MGTYHMPYAHVMDLPMRAFWYLSGTVERIWAEADKRHLMVVGAGSQATPDAAATLWDALEGRSPHPIKLTAKAHIENTAKPDEGAFDKLRRMAG